MTIDPRPCSIVVGRAARIVRNVEVRSPSRTAPPRRCHLVGRLWLPVSAGERGEQVDRSELLGKDGEGVLQRAGVGLIGQRRHGTAAVGPDPVHNLLDRGDVAATDADEGPMAGQPDPSRGPDPARSAGDHRDPPSQPGHLLHRVGHHAPSFPDPLRDRRRMLSPWLRAVRSVLTRSRSQEEPAVDLPRFEPSMCLGCCGQRQHLCDPCAEFSGAEHGVDQGRGGGEVFNSGAADDEAVQGDVAGVQLRHWQLRVRRGRGGVLREAALATLVPEAVAPHSVAG